MADAGYPYGFRSNITVFTGAAVSDIPQQAVENWVNSPGHLQAMLAPECGQPRRGRHGGAGRHLLLPAPG